MASVFDRVLQAQGALQQQRSSSLLDQARQQAILQQAAQFPLQQQQLQQQVQAFPLEQRLREIELGMRQQQLQRGQSKLGVQDILLGGRLAEEALRQKDHDIADAIIRGGVSKLGLDIDPDSVTVEQLQSMAAQGRAVQDDLGPTAFQEQNLSLQKERLDLERQRLQQGQDRLGLQENKLLSTINTALQEAISKAKSRGQELGKGEANKFLGAENAINIANDTMGLIDEILIHPGLEGATGFEGVINPANFVPGTPEYDFALKLEQLQGRAFLEAFQSLKGGGQITQIEGEKATAAIEQLSRRQSKEQFVDALTGLKNTAQRGRDNAESTLNKKESRFQEGQTATNPATGEKVIFRGGEWQPL